MNKMKTSPLTMQMIEISLVLLICDLSRTIKGQLLEYCEDDADCRARDAKSCVKFSGCQFGACFCPASWAQPEGVCTEPATILEEGDTCSSEQPAVKSCGPHSVCVACPNQTEHRCRSVLPCSSDDPCPLGNACLKYSGCGTISCTCPFTRQDMHGKCLEPSKILEKEKNCTSRSKSEICNTRKLLACLPCFNGEAFKCRTVLGSWTRQPTVKPPEEHSSSHQAIIESMLLVLISIIHSISV